MIYRLSDDPRLFPNPYEGEEDGLLAVGGDLSPIRLLTAYLNGIFPWYGFNEREEILWWCPLDRFVIFPNEIHISHSMRQLIRRGVYRATINEAFGQVIRQCSNVSDRHKMRGAWLGQDMIDAYTRLHDMGYANSVEVWDEDNNLIGGLYGVQLGCNFFGESMFSLKANASKFALIHLAQHLAPHGGLIDCQFETPHLLSMGGRHISYDEYIEHIITTVSRCNDISGE